MSFFDLLLDLIDTVLTKQLVTIQISSNCNQTVSRHIFYKQRGSLDERQGRRPADYPPKPAV